MMGSWWGVIFFNQLRHNYFKKLLPPSLCDGPKMYPSPHQRIRLNKEKEEKKKYSIQIIR